MIFMFSAKHRVSRNAIGKSSFRTRAVTNRIGIVAANMMNEIHLAARK